MMEGAQPNRRPQQKPPPGKCDVRPSVLQKMVRGPFACNGTRAMCVITAMKMPLLATGQDRHPPAAGNDTAGVQVEDGSPQLKNRNAHRKLAKLALITYKEDWLGSL